MVWPLWPPVSECASWEISEPLPLFWASGLVVASPPRTPRRLHLRQASARPGTRTPARAARPPAGRRMAIDRSSLVQPSAGPAALHLVRFSRGSQDSFEALEAAVGQHADRARLLL